MRDDHGRTVVDLSGTWTLTDETGAHSVAMTLPGDGISALHAAGAIPDPYAGRNEYDLRWIGERDWVARRTVRLERGEGVLVLSGLDTVAEVRVNGMTVLEAANAFREWRADIAGAAVEGENEIEIRFLSAVRVAAERAAEQPWPVPYHAGNCPIPHGNMLRKPQCDFGWDWNIALAPFGVWGAMRIEPPTPERITGVSLSQEHAPGRVRLTVTAHVEGAEGERVEADCAGAFGSAIVAGGRAAILLEVAEPALWWPAGLGEQTLHELAVRVGRTETVRRVGFRSLEHVSEADASGRSFLFRINGHDHFARGANWIPADALSGRITREGVRDLLQSAVDANMTMLRVWGGGRYEPDWFYDLCDEMGLMVWQDFMFACHLYPATETFLAEVEAEVREAVLRLNTHACLALWCGDNELVGALNWFPESRADRDRYLVSYDRLNRTVERALKAVLPEAPWWPSSPSTGPLSFGDAWHDDRSGDMHFWSVWHEGRDFEHYRDVSPRFCSEFGFQSYPSMDVVARFAAPQEWNIASPVMESHQKNAGGNARIAETMFRYFRFPEGFGNFVYMSQVQQGLAIQTAVDHWRSLKPHCMGTLYWQLNDTWPCASWSSLDHGGGWKILHHMARRFFAPVRVMAVPGEDGIRLMGVNDTLAEVSVSVRALAVTPAGEARLLAESEQVVGTAAAVALMRLPPSAIRTDEILVWRWADSAGGTGEEHFAPRPYKTYGLVPAEVSVTMTRTAEGWQVGLTARALALFVSVEAGRGRLSDNALTLLPGETRRILFRPDEPDARPEITVRDLYGATHERTRTST